MCVTERLIDQLHNLANLQRALDELQVMAPPHSTDERFRSAVVVEPTPRLYLSILRDTEGRTRTLPESQASIRKGCSRHKACMKTSHGCRS